MCNIDYDIVFGFSQSNRIHFVIRIELETNLWFLPLII